MTSDDFYTDEELSEIFDGEGLRVYIQETWLDETRVGDEHIRVSVDNVYQAWWNFLQAVDEADLAYQRYLGNE